MGTVPEILQDSFRLLVDEPRLFVPKVVSTLTASLFLVFLLSKANILVQIAPSISTPGVLVGLFMLSLLGVYSSMMLSSMVKNQDSSLSRSFIEVKNNISNVLTTSFGFMILSLLTSGIVGIGYVAYWVVGELYVIALFALLFLTVLIAVSYASYFLPITLLERKSFRSAMNDSLRTSQENRGVVAGLLVFSLVLMGIAIFSTGYLEKLGYVGFVAGRLVSSVVNTYVFVVSPNYYLESRAENLD